MQEIFVFEDLLNSLITLEQQGAKFYETCKNSVEDANLQKLFAGLAHAENKHEGFYKNLKNTISNNEDFLLDDEYKEYISTLIHNNFFVNNPNISINNLTEAFDIAEKLEKDTILFLNELSTFMILTKEIKLIINEEKEHLLTIYKYKKEYCI